MKTDKEIWTSEELSQEKMKIARGYGLISIALGAIFIFGPETEGILENICDVGGMFLVAEGLGDLITGKHHYTSLKAYDIISSGINYIGSRR
jgi:hypothetical protein